MVTISIDKLSFTGRIDTNLYTDMVDYLNATPEINDYRHTPWNFLYQHNWNFKVDGLFLQMGVYEKERVVRVEFNPNKITNIKFLHDIIKRVKHPNITRLDWAVDYEKDLSSCEFKLRTRRKSSEYRGRSGRLETKYLGSPKSDNFTRIYNKALERAVSKKRIIEDVEEEIEVNDVLWRVESVVKDFNMYIEQEVKTVNEDGEGVTELQKVAYEYLFQNPFSDLAIMEKREHADNTILKMSEKAMLLYLEQNPDEWANLSTNTRKKYEKYKYTTEWQFIEKQPSQIFEQEKSRLANELEALLKPALDNTRYLVGKTSNLHYSLDLLRFQETGRIE